MAQHGTPHSQSSSSANGSRECALDDRLREAIVAPAVIASAAKQSIAPQRKNGLLRCARNDGLRAMAQHGTPHSQSSSPANGSHECAPDDRLREAFHRPGRHCKRSEAIHLAAQRKNGLLRCARNDGAGVKHTFTPSRRDAPESLINLSPKEGVGNVGCPWCPEA